MLGKTLSGRYQIIRRLGGGSFGATFIAEDRQRPGNPQCVVKQLKPQSTDSFTLITARRLFNSEANVLETLGKHQRIPQLLAYFEENEEFYLVQELISGHDLSSELIPGRIYSEEEVISLMQDILEILVFIQEHNVIHRDIKPSNLIRRHSDGKIVLIDFGAVKQIANQVVDAQGKAITTPTIAAGTFGYMPIEQLKGYPHFCSDIYAVGVLGIQALTGVSPNQFARDESGEIVWRDLLLKDSTQTSPLANILDKMSYSDCRERYQSAQEALSAVNKLVTHTASTVVSQDNFTPPVASGQSRKPKLFLWLGFGSLGLIAAIAGIFSLLLKSPQPSGVTFESYQNSLHQLKINYPTNWSRQETPNATTGDVTVFLSPLGSPQDNFREQLSISVENFSSRPMSLGEYSSESIQQIRNYADANAPAPTMDTLANRRAMKVVYNRKDGNLDLQIMQIWMVRDNRAYVLTYAAQQEQYEQFLPTINNMIRSFQVE